MIKAEALVLEYRDKAIATLRLKKVNGLVEDQQYENQELKSLNKRAAEIEETITQLTAGTFAPSLDDVTSGRDLEKEREKNLERLQKELNRIGEDTTASKKRIEEINTAMAECANGKKPFNRNLITDLSSQLIEDDASSLTLDAVAEEASAEDDESDDED